MKKYHLLPLAIIVVAFWLLDEYQGYKADQKQLIEINDLLMRQKLDIQYDLEQLERRLSEINTNLEGLYNLFELSQDINANRTEIRQLYQSNLKYAFLFVPRNVSTQRLSSQFTSSSFNVTDLHEELVRLYYEQETVNRDQRGLHIFRESDSWTEFFVSDINVMTFQTLDNNEVVSARFSNLLMKYIQELEVSFLSLQSLQNQYKRTEELLDLELKVRELNQMEVFSLDSIASN